MPNVSLRDVDVFFSGNGLWKKPTKGNKALQSINIDIGSNERVGLIGPNGSGKSTLLRVMAGIFPPTQGKVNVEGRVSSMLTMGLGMQLDYSGFKNIDISLILSGVPREERKQLREEIAEFSELGDFLYQPVRNYSSGMAMRLKFACATAIKPDILLLDEWLGAGDVDFKEKATARMNGLVSEAGIVILATHNIPLMKRVCSKAIWLEHGKLFAQGDIEDVIHAQQRFKVYGETPKNAAEGKKVGANLTSQPG